jgi:hypothetical protein
VECGGGGGVEVLLKERQSREGGTFRPSPYCVIESVVASGVICTIDVMGADD